MPKKKGPQGTKEERAISFMKLAGEEGQFKEALKQARQHRGGEETSASLCEFVLEHFKGKYTKKDFWDAMDEWKTGIDRALEQ